MNDQIWTGEHTEPVLGAAAGFKSFRVHHPSRCEGRYCVIHNPSDHHMRSWPTVYRSDKGTMERNCPHGVGHPDPDDLAYHKSEGRAWAGVHGCDGCCDPDSILVNPPIHYEGPMDV